MEYENPFLALLRCLSVLRIRPGGSERPREFTIFLIMHRYFVLDLFMLQFNVKTYITLFVFFKNKFESLS